MDTYPSPSQNAVNSNGTKTKIRRKRNSNQDYHQEKQDHPRLPKIIKENSTLRYRGNNENEERILRKS